MKTLLIGGIILVIAIGLSYCEGKRVERRSWELAEQQAQIKAQNENKKVEARIRGLQEALEAERNNIKVKKVYVKDDVEKVTNDVQKSDSDCNASNDAMLLLNEKRGYPIGSSLNPRLPKGESGKASSYTSARILEELYTCELDYQDVMVRYNSCFDLVWELEDRINGSH